MFDLKNFLLDLFFPIQCFGCGVEGKWLCPDCIIKIKINSEIVGLLGKNNYLSGLLVASDYNQKLLAEALHAFKYNFAYSIGFDLAEVLLRFLEPIMAGGKFIEFDLVVAVPLAKKRKLWRGFNQAEILAGEVCRKYGWPLSLELLARKFHTHPQVGLDAKTRLANVRDIFQLKNSSLLDGKDILLVDDVFTTGATMQECAKILKQGGANTVWGLVLAKG